MKFTNIVGHEHLKPRLSKFIGIPQTYLFFGPPSVGKRTIAFELARYFLCRGTKEDDCTCYSCRSYSVDHPDMMCVGTKKHILVEDINRIMDFVVYAPLCSENKVVIIDNVDEISYEASNRLLKTLEESSSIFFLITSKVKAVLPPVRSRCLKVQFNSLSHEDTANILWKRMGFDLPLARILGWIGSGSSVDIFSNAGLYLKYRDMSFDFINLFFSNDFINLWDFLDRIPKNDLVIFIDMLVLLLTDILLLGYSIDLIINSDRRPDLMKVLKKLPPQKGVLILVILSQVKKNAHLNINMPLALKSAMIKVWDILKAS